MSEDTKELPLIDNDPDQALIQAEKEVFWYYLKRKDIKMAREYARRAYSLKRLKDPKTPFKEQQAYKLADSEVTQSKLMDYLNASGLPAIIQQVAVQVFVDRLEREKTEHWSSKLVPSADDLIADLDVYQAWGQPGQGKLVPFLKPAKKQPPAPGLSKKVS